MKPFPSPLPPHTVLDCILDDNWHDNGILHVLDVLKWKGQDIADCETPFRYRPKFTSHSPLPRFFFLFLILYLSSNTSFCAQVLVERYPVIGIGILSSAAVNLNPNVNPREEFDNDNDVITISLHTFTVSIHIPDKLSPDSISSKHDPCESP